MQQSRNVFGVLLAFLATAACSSAGGPPAETLDVHVVLGPVPVTPGASVFVRIDDAMGTTQEATTDATGVAHFTGGTLTPPFTITVARAGYAAVSIVDAMGEPVGDVRLDPLSTALVPTSQAIHGMITGIAPGDSVILDVLAGNTVRATATGAYTTQYADGIDEPLQISAVEVDAAGRAVNGIASTEQPRGGEIQIDLAMPAVPPSRSTTTVDLGFARLETFDPSTIAPISFNGPTHSPTADSATVVFVGAGTLTRAGAGFSWTIDVLEGLPSATRAQAIFDVSGDLMTVQWHELDGGTHALEVPGAATLPDTTGDSLATLVVLGDAPGYDTIALHIGETFGVNARWRVFYPAAAGGNRRVPRLPTAVRAQDIGLEPGTVTILPLLMLMHEGAPWTARDVASPTPQVAVQIAPGYRDVDSTLP